MTHDSFGRRDFLKAAGAGLMIIKPELVRGTQANSAVRVGLLGCGGRGTGVAEGMEKNAGARISALGDMFEDQVTKAKGTFTKVEASQVFTGPHAAEKMAASKEIDAIYIATPPYYHPEHLGIVVNSGKHVYCEKPVAVDVAGAKHVLEIGKKAEGKLSLDVGFQIRQAPPFVELVKRIHEGALGDIVCGRAHYYATFIDRPAFTGSATLQRLRNWIYDRVLSGDIIVEQNIHAIDICNWVLKGHPVKAAGVGGRKGRTEAGGTCYSHFDVVYTYPNEVHVGFDSKQFGEAYFDVNEQFFGTLGASSSPYAGKLGIEGKNAWTFGSGQQQPTGGFSATGSFGDNLADADPEKQRSWIGSITSGKFHNQSALGVESALTCMLGRMAAYTGRPVTWEELLKSNEKWESGINLEKLT
ncbi:MAG TPA: Gfo/Idh/MocA family oxidoreductase [Bryobacteraceae bacterium]